MSDEVSWLYEITLKPGAADDATALVKEMVDANYASEPDTLSYQVSITDDGARVHFSERFRDSEAALYHVSRFAENFAARVLHVADVTRFEIYGNPSDELKHALATLNPTYLSPVAGFTR